MSSTMVAFFASFTALIGTPVVAPVGAWLLARQRSIVQRRSFQLLLGGLGCVATGLWFGVATALYEVNAVLLGLAYLAFGVVAISAFRLRPRLLGFSLGTVATLFLLPSLLLGTVGALGVENWGQENWGQTPLNHIELNPVRAGMVGHPRDYPWSSHRRYAYGEMGVNLNWLIEPDQYRKIERTEEARKAAYRDLFKAGVDADDLTAIRDATHKGWALGDKRFRDMIGKTGVRHHGKLGSDTNGT